MVFKKRSIGVLLTGVFALVGCETTKPESTLKVAGPFSSLKANKEVSPPIAYAINLLREEKYTEASQFLNQALQSQPKNPIYHILNALTYEKLAERGDATGLELACIGYQNAINLDPSNVFAITQLGKIDYRDKRYAEAQENFANALLITPNDADLLHELAAASYYAYDAKTALSAITKAEKLKPDDPLIQRSSAMIHAALGDFNTAKKHLAVFQNKMGNDPAVNQLTARLNDWQHLYKSGRIKLTPAIYPGGPEVRSTEQSPYGDPPPFEGPPPPGEGPPPPPGEGGEGGGGGGGNGPPPGEGGGNGPPPGGGGGNGPPPGGGGGGASPAYGAGGFASSTLSAPLSTENAPSTHGPQIIVDCYLLRITEDAITSKGNNILENLAVTLNPGSLMSFKGHMTGNGVSPVSSSRIVPDNVSYMPDTGFNSTVNLPTGQAPSVWNPSATTVNLANKGSLSGSIFTSGITWAGLTYSLNIANAIDNRTELVSRPSLMSFVGKQSVFFSGNELVIGLSGQFGGTLTKYPVGVTLLVTPESLEGDLVTLNIAIEGSILTAPNPNLQQTVNVGKTRVDTFAKVRLGETLMLGGIYEREEIDSNSGFPGLRDTPIVQYFFSNQSTSSSRRSIVFMLTPRSPDAVKTAVNRAMSRGAIQAPNLSELRSRNPDWFNTQPNLVTIFRYLEKDPIIYYEFRSGDILPPSWGWEPSLRDKLARLESFIYY